MVAVRCGIDTALLDTDAFATVSEFDTDAIAVALGSLTAQVSRPMMQSLGSLVRQIDSVAFVKGVYDILTPGGYFIFSQEHPLTTAPISGASWAKDENGNVLHYKLTDYSRCGKRTTTWIVDGVEKYHRTFSEIINSLCSAGFTIETMLEPTPTQEIIEMDKSWEKDLHKPNFLLINVRK